MRSLSAKFLVPTLALILVCMTAMAYLIYNKAYTFSLESADSINESKLSSTVSLIDMWISGLENEVLLASRLEPVVKAAMDGKNDKDVRETARVAMRKIIKDRPILTKINIIDITGETVASTTDVSIGNNYTDRKYFQQQQQPESYSFQNRISVVPLECL